MANRICSFNPIIALTLFAFANFTSVKASTPKANLSSANQQESLNYNHMHSGSWVDLGLPSGTLWATCNIGAESPEENGYYFAHGEVSIKDSYTWQTYNAYLITKYLHTNDNILKIEDDAASICWGQDWRIPTEAQFRELYDFNFCIWEWKNLNGANGFLITSKSNNNSIFLPAAGFEDYINFVLDDEDIITCNGTLYNEGITCSYWASNIDISRATHAAAIRLDKGEDNNSEEPVLYMPRNRGNAIRPVFAITINQFITD